MKTNIRLLTWLFLFALQVFADSQAKYQPEVLAQLLEKVRLCVAKGERPIVIFDLDETIINSQIRALRILKDIAQQKDITARYPSESKAISQLQPGDIRAYPLYVGEILKNAGIDSEALVKDITRNFVDQYLSNNYCTDDWPIAGACAYVNLLHQAGAWIVYLTGRNRPGMEQSTMECLRRNRFPLGEEQHAFLVMKPTRDMNDTVFKGPALETIATWGVVVGGFENEPANVNVFKARFPEALMVFVDTVHSNRPDVPRADIPWIANFILPSVALPATAPRLVADQEYQTAVTEALTKASKTIDIVQFEFFTENGFVASLADLLIAKKQAEPGLQIRVFLEGDKEGIAARNLQTKEKLAKAGIAVKMDSSNRVTHVKFVLVDGKILLLGSHNWSNTSILKNNETSVRIESEPLGKLLGSYVDTLFADASPNYPVSGQDKDVRILADATYLPAALALIRNAQTSLDIAMYYIAYRPGKDNAVKTLLDELVNAKKRGVRVRLVLEQSSGYAHHITAANKEAAQYLHEKGVTDIFWDRPEQISHAKYIIRDGEEVLMGSTNWYDKDFDVNHQINAQVSSAGFAQILTALFTTKITGERN